MKSILFNLSLSKKLLVQTCTFIVSFLFALAIVFTSQHFLASSGQSMEQLDKFRVNISELRTSLNALRGEIFVSLMSDPATMQKEITQSRARFEEHRTNVDKMKRSLTEIRDVLGSEELNRSSKELFTSVDVLTRFSDQYIALAAKADQVNRDSLYQVVLEKVLGDFEPMFIAFRKSVIASNKIAESLREKAFKDYQDTVAGTNIVLILFFVLTATFVFIFSRFLSTMISRPVLKTKDTLERISGGELPKVDGSGRKDEIGSMLNSLKTLVSNLENLKAFTLEVGKGNFESQVTVFENKGAIAESLQVMRDGLKQSSIKEQQAAWISKGLAETGTILRLERSHATMLYERVLSFVVKYLSANQGSLFITLDEDERDKKLELAACFAYDRKKYQQKTFSFGEGLIGQACLEQELICMTQLPANYISITSGLGGATPSCLAILPLVHDEGVHGVIEIASFKKMEEHQLDFLKQFGQLVVAEIASEKVNGRTRDLLEKSQQQAEELKAQEEEMRQNMEELQATQETEARHAKEIERSVIQMKANEREVKVREMVFGYTTILSEADRFGAITFVNDKLCEVSKYSRDELIGKPHNVFRHADMPKELFKAFWDTIKSGKVFKGIIKNRAKDGTHYWVDATIVPVEDENGKVNRYIGARYHIEDDKIAEYLYNEQLIRMGLKTHLVNDTARNFTAVGEGRMNLS